MNKVNEWPGRPDEAAVTTTIDWVKWLCTQAVSHANQAVKCHMFRVEIYLFRKCLPFYIVRSTNNVWIWIGFVEWSCMVTNQSFSGEVAQTDNNHLRDTISQSVFQQVGVKLHRTEMCQVFWCGGKDCCGLSLWLLHINNITLISRTPDAWAFWRRLMNKQITIKDNKPKMIKLTKQTNKQTTKSTRTREIPPPSRNHSAHY